MDARTDRAPIGILDTQPDGTIEGANQAARSLLDIEGQELAGADLREIFPESVDNTVVLSFDGSVTERSRVEEYYPALDRWFEVTIVPTGEQVTVYLRDVSEHKEQAQSMAELQSDLERLTIINQLISDIIAELVGASSREEIAATICNRLGETDIYEFAWIGERELGGEDIVVRAAAGSTGRTLERIEEALDGEATPPEQRVVESGEPAIVQPLSEDQAVPEAVRRSSFADGLQSLLAIPLTYGSSVHGVVGIYASDQDAFSERERASFATLGEMAGFAINASRNRNLLVSDSIVELAIEITDPATPVVSVTTEQDAEIAVEGVVPQSDETLVCYLFVEEAAPSAVAELFESREQVRSVRVIGEHGESGSVEVELDGETPLGYLSAQGVTIATAEFESGRGHVEIELSPGEDVRRIASAVTREFDASVIAKRERDQSIRTAQEFRDELSERLTDRQEEALRTAFFADYFESPRGSTAEEVATTLDITGPTLLHHLRAGQRKLLDEFFEASRER